MIDLISTIQLILRDAAFHTSLLPIEGCPGILFEDDAIVGSAFVFADSSELLTRWRRIESEFLAKHAHGLRRAGDKAWNVYTVLISQRSGNSDMERRVRWIEENLEKTRKVTASGVETRDDLITALLPLLPIQHRPSLMKDDATERLRHRISLIAPSAAETALNGEIPPEEIVRLLGELK